MHILGILIGLLAAGAFWYYRLKMIRDAGSEVADAVGRLQGKHRRNKIRKSNHESPITAIDDPVTAYSTLMFTLLENPQTVVAQDRLITSKLMQFSDQKTAQEATVYGRWAANQGVAVNRSVKLLCDKLNNWLSDEEKMQAVGIIQELQDSDLFTLSESRTTKTRALLSDI